MTDTAAQQTREQQLLEVARAGDRGAFGPLFDPYRRELLAHCYRMLGSYADAEDALQETQLRAWRGLGDFGERSSLRSWLYRIATNACLRVAERRPQRMLPIDFGPASDPQDGLAEPLTEPVWLEPYPDTHGGYEQRESVELAFIAALQHLPARQRAVLILRDVLDFSARETASLLDTSPPAVDSALQRAHKTVDDRLPNPTQQQTLAALGDDTLRGLVDRFVEAWERNDVDTVVSMLADDARMTMPPLPTWYSGRDQIAAFLRGLTLSDIKRWRLLPTAANAQPALAGYLWDADAEAFTPYCLYVLAFGESGITEITAFVGQDSFARFGLPASV